MKKLSILLLIPSFIVGIFFESPAHANWFKKNIKKLDVTDRNSDINKLGNRIDPTNPNSAGGRFTRKAVPVACAVKGAVVASPAALSGAGVLVTVGAGTAAYTGCYQIIKNVQNN